MVKKLLNDPHLGVLFKCKIYKGNMQRGKEKQTHGNLI